jgi:hypothetical protein
MKVTPIFSLDYTISFGKYKDEKMRNVIQLNVRYVDWLLAEGIIRLDEAAYKHYQKIYFDGE